MANSDTPWTSTETLKKISGLPDYGWRVGLDKQFTENVKPFNRPRLRQMISLMGMSIRFIKFIRKKYREGKRPFIDIMRMVQFNPIYGVPIGGIGCGTIGRGFRGEFCRFQMVPGIYEHQVVSANQFVICIRKGGQTVYQQVLSPRSCKPKGRGLSAWKWEYDGSNATYHGLYPRSWTVYDIPQHSVRLICKQISPIFPNDYKDTSLPAAVFVWTVENQNPETVDVSLMFTFKNGQGTQQDKEGGVTSMNISCEENESPIKGVIINQSFRDMPCSYTIAAKCKASTNVSVCPKFDPNSTGEDIWEDLYKDGKLQTETGRQTSPTSEGEELGVAVCAQCTVPSNGKEGLEFALAWHMPVIHFGSRETEYRRRYTRWFDENQNGAVQLISYALNNHETWEEKIDQWQQPILRNKKLPSWYKSALFNELYFISDGGSVWVDVNTQDSQQSVSLVKEYGKFAYLEGHEYRMYNTYDVHHYASFALLLLWPKLQLSLQYDMAEAIGLEIPDSVQFLADKTVDMIKAKGCVPHDVGDPEDDPWKKVNAYIMHPTQDWKDLNTKFVLQVYRDFIVSQDTDYLNYMYPVAKHIVDQSMMWDKDGDGLIENSGFADQTYDAWVVSGPSAYCGSMWLAALHMMREMATHLGKEDDSLFYARELHRGKTAFEDKLWNGRYYNYDSSKASYHDSIMADQLAGQWFLKASNVPDDTVFPKDHVISALKTVFDSNVMPFKNGTMGAINGMRPNGKKDITSLQSEEFWTGVTYALAASMMQEGLMEEGWRTAYGVYHTVYECWGLGFQTPEAYTEEKRYRSLGYMRPLAIWAIHHALHQYHPQLLHNQSE